MNSKDQEILTRIQNPLTREQGFRELILLHQQKVYRVIRRMVLIHEDADDITQNTFIKAHRHIDKFQGHSSLFTWLYRIATNEALGFIARKKRRLFLPIENYQQKLESYVDQSSHLSGEEIETKLKKALIKLPEKQRLVFLLRYQEELTYDQIAEITGTSIGALKASYHHAAKKIEQSIKQE